MERLEKKIIKGHPYYYYTKWEWVNGKCRRTWQKYLGKLENIVQAVDAGGHPPRSAELFEWGLSSTLWQECCRARVIAKVDEQCPKRHQGLSIGEYIAIASINRAIQPKSKSTLYAWFAQSMLRRAFPTASQAALAPQRFWDHMSLITPEKTQSIWKSIIKDTVEREAIDLSSVCYDGTNFYTFIDTFNARCKIAKRGKNKQGRANLRQISYALFCSTKEQVPLYYEIYEGNRHDTKQFPVMLEQFQAWLRETFDHKGDACEVTLIFDKGNNSQENFHFIDTLNLHYVGSKKLSELKELTAISNEDGRFRACQTIGLESTKAFRVAKKVYGKERILVVTFNQNLFNTQLLTLHTDIAKAITHLEALDQKLTDRANGLITRGKCPTVASINTQCQALLTRPYLKEVILYKVTKEGDHVPRLTYEIDTDAMKRLADTSLGKNILVTSREHWSNDQIILAYRSQFHIENMFKEMKDRDIGNWWPLYHWTDQKIYVHGFYCTIALLLRALAHRRLQQAGITISMKRMLTELEDVKEVLLVYPRKRRAKTERSQTVLSKTSELQQSLLSILGIKKAKFG